MPTPDEPGPDGPADEPREPESDRTRGRHTPDDDPRDAAAEDTDSPNGDNASGYTASTPTDERANLDGDPPPRFSKPPQELTLTEALTPPPGRLARIRPAAMMGGQLLPGAIARRAAHGATLTPIVHPGLAPPEPRYRPSKKLADFVRCRDQTCRFPGCRETGHPLRCGPYDSVAVRTHRRLQPEVPSAVDTTC